MSFLSLKFELEMFAEIQMPIAAKTRLNSTSVFWLAQLVRSLPSSHEVPGPIPKISVFVRLSFRKKRSANEYQHLLGANLQWISVPSRGS